MAAAVLLPASLVVFQAERFLLAEADGIHAIGGDSKRYEIFSHGGGATVAEAEVVFGRAALVAVTLDGYSYRWIGFEVLRGLGESLAAVGAYVGFVIIKISIVDCLLEGRRCGSRRGWRSRSVHGNRGGSGSGATGAVSGNRVGGGIRGCDLCGTTTYTITANGPGGSATA